MRCALVEPLVERFVDGTLDSQRAREIEEHARVCVRCTASIEAAAALLKVFAAEPPYRAPREFAARVMDAVYREALAGGSRPAREEQRGSPARRLPAGIYRRLGLSFVLTAGVLAMSLFIPRVAYPVLIGTGSPAVGFSREGGAVVRSALDGADTVVRGILNEHGDERSAR
jgi:hypothetical protein